MKKLFIILFCVLSLIGYSQTDDCTGATTLTVGATCTPTTFANNENGRPETGAPTTTCDAASPGSDVWYSVTGTGGNVEVTLSGADRNGTLAIWTNCPATTMINCISVLAANSGSIIFPTTAATTYYIQIKRQSGGDNANMSGSICARSISSSAPPNDNCSGAINLTAATACTYVGTTNLNATNSTGVPAPGCASYAGGDVWYSVVIPASGSVNLDTQANSMTDGGMAVYSGGCGALTLISCDDDSGAGLMPALTVNGTVGTTIYIRVWEYGNNNNGTFGICAVAGAAVTGNQNCSTATQICNDQSFTGNSNNFGTQELSFTNQGCLSTEHQSSWYYFSPTSTGTISLAIKPASGVDYDFAIWGPLNTLACPPSAPPLRCSFASGFSTSFESVQASPLDYSTGLHTNAWGNGNVVGASDGTGTDILDGWVSPITVGAADVGKVYIMLIDNFTANSTPFTIDFTLTCGLNCLTLPIELLSFTVKNIDGVNVINWVTASERDNDYFTVERSIDGYNWTILSKIDGGGTDNSENMYEYVDNEFINTINYYRLKQIDFNGEFKYYEPVSIDNKIKNKKVNKIYNMLGVEVDEFYIGLKVYYFTDGTIEKRF